MGEATEREAGERPAGQDDGDDLVLRIMTVAEESGSLDDDCQALLRKCLPATCLVGRRPDRSAVRSMIDTGLTLSRYSCRT